jgi:NAD(P)-dependent dehydrogenase (short-subunit alcohol dehydrogenase family)
MKTVLITGVSKGIGEALRLKFTKEGFDVLGTVYTGVGKINTETGTESCDGVPKAKIFELDLSSPESIERCANEIIETGTKIDILINNAGALFDEDDTSVIVDKLRKTLEVNLVGPIDFTERLISQINSGGQIINISSSAGSLEKAGRVESHYPYHYPSYKISKAGLNMYTCTLAQRLKKSDIIVSSVHPGWVRTDLGGPEADITAEEAALGIYSVVVSDKETGGFWFGKERMPW